MVQFNPETSVLAYASDRLELLQLQRGLQSFTDTVVLHSLPSHTRLDTTPGDSDSLRRDRLALSKQIMTLMAHASDSYHEGLC